MRRKLSIIIILVLALTLLAGCRSTPQPLPMPVDDTPAGILPAKGDDAEPLPSDEDDPAKGCGLVDYGVAGEILSIELTENDDILGVIEVKGEPSNGAMYDYAMVSVTPKTKIYGNEAAAFEGLEVGMNVAVFFEGPVAESYPVQGRASQVNVVDTGEWAEE